MSEQGRECGGQEEEGSNGARSHGSLWATGGTWKSIVSEVGRVMSMGVT